MDTNEKKILIFTSAAHYLTHLFILVFPALVMPISRDLAISPSEAISISFPMYLCYGILAVPWGYLSDRFGPRQIMGVGILIAGFGFIAAAIAQSINQLMVFLSIIGFGCSAYHPSGLALLSRGMSVRGRAMGINGLWGNFGIASAPFLAGVLAYWMDWQRALIVFGITGIIIGAVCLLAPLSVGRGDLQKSTSVDKRDAITLFIILCAAMLFSGIMYRSYTVILPTFFESKLTDLSSFISGIVGSSYLTPAAGTLTAAIISSSVYLLGMIGQLIGGRVADRFDLRMSYLLFFSCALPFLISLLFFEGPVLIILIGFFILFALGMQPIENSLVAILTPPQWRSLSYSIKFTIIFGAGSVGVHLVSFVKANYGLDSVIILLSSLLMMIIFMINILLYKSRGTSIKHKH
ncbi:MAG: MFS transporter [Spirochaetota bacterium]|nr:MFS transporter [Spirochaetota bacterium]